MVASFYTIMHYTALNELLGVTYEILYNHSNCEKKNTHSNGVVNPSGGAEAVYCCVADLLAPLLL